jgi:LPS-assembly lipoprotein
MSWARPLLLAALAFAAALALGGCTVRPLYAPAPLAVAGPQAELAAIGVAGPSSRQEQVYRNALLFGLRGGAVETPERYSLSYRLGLRSQEIGVERGTGTPNAYQLTGTLSFLLRDRATGESVFGASVTATDTYVRSSQNYANIRAARDAEDRLGKALAELTVARLAAYFATH